MKAKVPLMRQVHQRLDTDILAAMDCSTDGQQGLGSLSFEQSVLDSQLIRDRQTSLIAVCCPPPRNWAHRRSVTCSELPTGIVPVPDERLEKLAELYGSEKILPATIEFVDIAGLVAGASKGEGLGNKFLANIR